MTLDIGNGGKSYTHFAIAMNISYVCIGQQRIRMRMRISYTVFLSGDDAVCRQRAHAKRTLNTYSPETDINNNCVRDATRDRWQENEKDRERYKIGRGKIRGKDMGDRRKDMGDWREEMNEGRERERER